MHTDDAIDAMISIEYVPWDSHEYPRPCTIMCEGFLTLGEIDRYVARRAAAGSTVNVYRGSTFITAIHIPA